MSKEIVVNQIEGLTELPPLLNLAAKPAKEFFGWTVLFEKLFNGEVIPGLEHLTALKFNILLNSHIEKYSLFIDGHFLYNALRAANYKLFLKNLVNAPGLSPPIHYYSTMNKKVEASLESFLKVIANTPQVETYFENMEPNLNTKLTPEQQIALRDKVSLSLLPNMYIKLLALLYKVEEVNREVNAVVLLANNIHLIPVIKELMDNDIAVYLGVSSKIKTPSRLLQTCSALIDIEDFLGTINALMPIKR